MLFYLVRNDTNTSDEQENRLRSIQHIQIANQIQIHHK